MSSSSSSSSSSSYMLAHCFSSSLPGHSSEPAVFDFTMEEENAHDGLSELAIPSAALDAFNHPGRYGSVSNHHFALEAVANGYLQNAMPSAHHSFYQNDFGNDAEFLSGSLTYLRDMATKDVLEGIQHSLDPMHVDRVSEILKDEIWFLKPRDGRLVRESAFIQSETSAQLHQAAVGPGSRTKQIKTRSRKKAISSVPGVTSLGHSSQRRHVQIAPEEKVLSRDSRRRFRIAESIKGLQGLVPNSTAVGQASALDDVIDYIKYLQLQLKDLTRSRLGGQAISDPLVFLEGYGHYIHDQTLKEPLEEMMGKLLEVNHLEAKLLLESRGLFLIPMALAEELVDETAGQV